MSLAGRSPWPPALVGAGVTATAIGLLGHQLWRVLPWERFALSLLLATAAWMVTLPLQRLGRCSAATALVVVWLAAASWFVGPAAMLAAMLLGSAALAIGTRIVGIRAETAPLSLALGLVAIAGPTGWLLPLPIHCQGTWALLLLLIVALLRNSLAAVIGSVRGAWQTAVADSPRGAALTVTLLGLAAIGCWFPTLQADDVAYHLGLPSQLVANGYYQPLPRFQMWAYAPWLGDTLQGIAAVLARGDARGAVNLLWLALSAGAVAAVSGRLRTDATLRWSAVAVFASFPPLVWLSAGMQTELAAIALMLCLLQVFLLPDLRGRHWIVASLFAGLMALKLIHVLTALPLLLWSCWRYRDQLRPRALIGMAMLALLLAGSSYVQAWLATGNPVLPLVNSVFQSPLLPLDDIADPRWHAGISWALPWQLVFNSTRYFEGWNGALGLALITLSGATLLTLRDAATRGAVLAVLLGLFLTLLPMQYARYAFPALVLLATLSLPSLFAALSQRSARALIIGLCVVNLAFQANASWLHHSGALKRLLRSGGESSEMFVHYLPERELIRRHGDVPGLWLSTDPIRHGIAELGERARTLSTHAPLLYRLQQDAERDPSGERWLSLIGQFDAQWLLVSASSASPSLRSALRTLDAEHVDRVGDVELWRLGSKRSGR